MSTLDFPYNRTFLSRSESRTILSVTTWRCCRETTLREAVTCREWGRLADWPRSAKLSRRLLWQWYNNLRESRATPRRSSQNWRELSHIFEKSIAASRHQRAICILSFAATYSKVYAVLQRASLESVLFIARQRGSIELESIEVNRIKVILVEIWRDTFSETFLSF